jgi:acetyl esterase
MADTRVPIKQAYDYQRAMDKVGSQCEIFTYLDQPHGFFNHRKRESPYYYKTVGDMLVFLDKHDYLTK